MSNTSIPLTEQVRQALATFIESHIDAERKIAAAAALKLSVGANETERKAQKASTPPDDYQRYVELLAEAEREKAAAVAHLERVEKHLNVTRELLQAENVSIQRAWAEIADRTAMRYERIQMTLPARPVVTDTPEPVVTGEPF